GSGSTGRAGTVGGAMPDPLVLKRSAGGQPVQLYRQGAEYGYFPASVKPYLRLPSGHPEGFHEALANLHRTLEWTIRGRRGEQVPRPFEHPGIADGVAGMAFIEAAVASSKQDGEWVEVPKVASMPKTVLFRNFNIDKGNSLRKLPAESDKSAVLARVVREYEVDILVLAECQLPGELLVASLREVDPDFEQSLPAHIGIQFFTRFPGVD